MSEGADSSAGDDGRGTVTVSVSVTESASIDRTDPTFPTDAPTGAAAYGGRGVVVALAPLRAGQPKIGFTSAPATSAARSRAPKQYRSGSIEADHDRFDGITSSRPS